MLSLYLRTVSFRHRSTLHVITLIAIDVFGHVSDCCNGRDRQDVSCTILPNPDTPPPEVRMVTMASKEYGWAHTRTWCTRRGPSSKIPHSCAGACPHNSACMNGGRWTSWFRVKNDCEPLSLFPVKLLFSLDQRALWICHSCTIAGTQSLSHSTSHSYLPITFMQPSRARHDS